MHTLEVDYEDDGFWDSLMSYDGDLGELFDAVKSELDDIEEERVLRRAEWDEFAAVDHDPADFRRALAEYSRWKYDMYVDHKLVSRRKAQVRAAQRDVVSAQGVTDSARTIIERLTRAIVRFTTDDEMTEDDLIDVLNSSWLVADGQRVNLFDLQAKGPRFQW